MLARERTWFQRYAPLYSVKAASKSHKKDEIENRSKKPTTHGYLRESFAEWNLVQAAIVRGVFHGTFNGFVVTLARYSVCFMKLRRRPWNCLWYFECCERCSIDSFMDVFLPWNFYFVGVQRKCIDRPRWCSTRSCLLFPGVSWTDPAIVGEIMSQLASRSQCSAASLQGSTSRELTREVTCACHDARLPAQCG